MPAGETEANYPECWKEGWESVAIELKWRENVKKEDIKSVKNRAVTPDEGCKALSFGHKKMF